MDKNKIFEKILHEKYILIRRVRNYRKKLGFLDRDYRSYRYWEFLYKKIAYLEDRISVLDQKLELVARL